MEMTDLNKMVRYLVYTYEKIENRNPAQAEYETVIYNAINEALKRMRKRVLNGTFVESFARKGFMGQMRHLLMAYNDHMVATEGEEELDWHRVLELKDRYELSSMLLDELHDYVHNYRSTREAA